MENQTMSFNEQRGVGGKLKTPARKRAPNTPYTRPPRTEARWFSKLVDPAYRLISGGASYIFPSVFSKSDANIDCDELESDNDDDGNNLNNVVSNSSKSAKKLKGIFDVDGNEIQKQGDSRDGVDEIEKLIKDKNFSRDEINHLLEIVRSKAADDSKVQGEKKSPNVVAQDVGPPLLSSKYEKMYEEDPEDFSRAICGTSNLQENKYSSPLFKNIGESAVSLETSRKPGQDELASFDRATWETSTPLPQPFQRNDVGASPIDIAKAYMENRTLEFRGGSRSLISKDNGVQQHDDGVASKPLIHLPSPKPSTCWPGAMAQDHHSYKTPLSQRGRSGLYNFPRTPYSRTIGSKSRSKLQGDSERHLSTMPSHIQQSQASLYGQVGSRANVLGSGHGSVGPIRRIERKVSENPGGFSYFRSPADNTPLEENSSAFEKGKTISSSKLWSVESKSKNTDISVPTVPSHSSEVARKILEHLDRNPPTPKDKSAEIKLATSWRKPQFSYATTSMTDRHSDSSCLGCLDSMRESETRVRQKNSNDDGRYPVFKASQENANKANASSILSNNNLASGMNFGFTNPTHSKQSVPTLDFSKSQGSDQLLSTHEDVSNAVKDAVGSEPFGLRNKPPSSGTKPVLLPISVSNPGQRLPFFMDNNSGFTFPVSASSTVWSEPPTPSILPSSTAGGLQDGNLIPVYSFGTKRSTPPIVFSFPSPSNAPSSNDSSDLKFEFGSEKSKRISFASVGKDPICC